MSSSTKLQKNHLYQYKTREFPPCLQAVGPHTTTLLPKVREKVADVHSKPTGRD